MLRQKLSVSNMDNIPLHQIFDHSGLENDPLEWFAITQDRKRRGEKEYVTLGDIYRSFDTGLAFPEVKKKFEGKHSFHAPISNKAVLIGEVFYKNTQQKPKRKRNLRVYCDECVGGSEIAFEAQRQFGYASNALMEGKISETDRNLLDSIINKELFIGKIDIVISKDRAQIASRDEEDLTNCFERLWTDRLSANGGVIDDEIRSYPTLIHVADGKLTNREIRKLLKKHRSAILKLRERCISPEIVMHKGHIEIGTHYLELIHGRKEVLQQDLIHQRAQYVCENILKLNEKDKERFMPCIRQIVKFEVQAKTEEIKRREPEVMYLIESLNNINAENAISEVGLSNVKSQIQRRDRLMRIPNVA